MKKMRTLCAAVLGFSLLLGNIGYAATLSFADTSVTAGKTYYYRMRAYRTVNGKKVLSNLTSIVSKKAK